MSTAIEGISVIFSGNTSALAAAGASADSVLASIGTTADMVGASLTGMGDRAIATGAVMDSLSASASADGEAFMSLSSVMAELDSLFTEQQIAISSDGEAMVTLGSAMAELSGFADQAAASMQAEGAAAEYLSLMAGTAAPALAEVAAASTDAAASMDVTAASADRASISMEGLATAGKVAGGLAIGLAVVGAATGKMAGDFQAGMLTIKTGAGGVNENISQLSQQVLGLSTATGTGTKGLTDGLFMIESAGQRGSQALLTLQDAAEAAKVGNADLGTVANGVTTIMTDFASKNVTAAQAANALVAAVGDGKTNMQDLSGSLSSILPVASSVKVGLNDVMGAMATMTGEGVPAADAATYLRQMLMTLASPSKAGAAALKEIGLSAQQVSDDMKKSLPDTLAEIEAHLKKKFPEGSIAYQDALKAIAGGSKQMSGMLDLTGSHLATFGSNVTDIAGKVKSGGSSVVGWSDVQQTFNFKMDQAKAALETLGITIGSKLLPLLTPMLGTIANLVNAFTGWINGGHAVSDMLGFIKNNAQLAAPIIGGLAAGVLAFAISSIPALVTAFGAWAASAWTAAAGTIAATWPILAIAAAVAGLIAIFVALYNHNAGFKAFIDGLVAGFKQTWQVISSNFMPAMKAVGDWLKSNLLPVFQQIGGFLVSTFTPVWQQLVQLWQGQLMPLFKQLWTSIQPLGDVFKQLLPVVQMIGAVIGVVLVGAFANLMGVIGGIVKGFAGFISGVTVMVGGVATMFRGLIQIVTGVVNLIKDIFTGNFKNIGNDIKQIFAGVQTYFTGLGTAMKGWFQAIFGGITGFIQGWIGGFMGTIGAILGIVQKTKIQAEQQQEEMKLHSINNAMQTTEGVLKHADMQRQMLLKELQDTKDPAKRHELEMQINAITLKEEEAKKVLDAEQKKKEGILKHLAELKQQEEEANKSIFQKVGDWFGKARDAAGIIFNDMKNKVMNIFNGLRNSVGSWFSSFGTFWHDRWTGIVNAVGNIFSTIGGAVKAAFNGVIDLINNVISSIDNINVAGFGVHIGLIPHLAGGGFIPPGQIAVVGETGKPEIAVGGPQGTSILGVNQTAALLASSRGGSGVSGGFAHGGGSQKITLVIPVTIDGREVARATIDDLQELMLSNARSIGHPIGAW